MKFDTPLLRGTLIKRYKRFLADVMLPGHKVVTAHCPNPGSMKGLVEPGNPVWISEQFSPTRRLKYTLEIIQVEGALVGVNTHRPNALVHEALHEGTIHSLIAYEFIKEEVKYGQNSRIDLLLSGEDLPKAYVEVKNVTLKENGRALFPDSVTERGTKHLRELMNVVAENNRAVMLYVVQREDCDSFSIGSDIDPIYAKAFLEAMEKGVEVLAYSCIVAENAIRIHKPIPLDLKF
ncbi:MAG: DNA/RNA nuclease SfsA [Alphaproteobacteria bacterium]